ncbi:hypothetical protein B0J14DRAFT_659293 [Halenospora varia]|nr:hypothetical protein B0J14DRAFT_659293 [Halenospora varia]
MSSPTLRQILKFPKDVQGLRFAPNGASIAFLVENVLMVFYKHSSGLFVPSCKPKISEGAVEVKDLKWISPHEIQYSPNQPSINLKKHRERFLSELGDVVPENHTVCQHWKNTRKCESCGRKEAQYNEHEARTTIRDEKDSSEKSMAKILDQGFVTIIGNEMSSKNQETPTKKRGHESDPEQSDTGKVKQVKVESSKDVDSDSSVPASPKGRVLEDIRESIET